MTPRHPPAAARYGSVLRDIPAWRPAHVVGSEPHVSSSFDGRVLVVGVGGELDAVSSPRIWRKIQSAVERAARSSVVVIDLTRIAFFDAPGVATLGNLAQRCRRLQVELRVVTEPDQRVRRVLALTGVDTLLTIYDSVEDATTTPVSLYRPIPLPPPV